MWRGYTLFGIEGYSGPAKEYSSLFPKLGMTYIGLSIEELSFWTEEGIYPTTEIELNH